MRQVGFLAAAGIYALDNNIQRLADDHRRARTLASELSCIPQLEVSLGRVETNMVFVNVPAALLDGLNKTAQKMMIKLPEGSAMRLVTHLDIDDDAIDKVVNLFQTVSG
jgi:threonine aldolase